MSKSKLAYFQGGGGVNEPTPGEKKYPVEKAITVQTRFVEPFYRNYDYMDTEGNHGAPVHGPGKGWNGMQDHKSVEEFLKFRRKRLKGKYVASDTWIEDTSANYKDRVARMKIRANIFYQLIKNAGPNYDLGKGLYQEMSDGKVDSVKEFREEGNHGPAAIMKKDINHIDFPIDDQIKSSPITVENEPYGGLIGEGPYFQKNDFEGKTPEQLDFGRDYTEDAEFPASLNEEDLEELSEKYLSPTENGLFGLPDGVDPEGHDADQTNNSKNSYYGISDEGRQMYEDKWNI